MTTTNDTTLLGGIIKASVLLLLVVAVASYLADNKTMAVSVIIGGFIAIMNFIWQRRALSRMLSSQEPVSTTGAAFRFILRLSVTALILVSVIARGTFSIPGLLLGLSCIVIVIVVFTFYAAFRKGE